MQFSEIMMVSPILILQLTVHYSFTLGNILLVVLRGIGAQRLDILLYVTSVVKEAARDRKTVRVSDG